MEHDEKLLQDDYTDIRESLLKIKQYLEREIKRLNFELRIKDAEIKKLRSANEAGQELMEGNKQLINKLLGDLSMLQNDVEWYKKTYERRSFLGVVREKLFHKSDP